MNGLVSNALPLQSSLRPDPIPRIQDAYLDSIEIQLLATVVLIAVVVLGTGAASRMQGVLRRRYGSLLAEVGSVAFLGAVVIASVYVFSVIWGVTYILELTLYTMSIDRLRAAFLVVSVAIVFTSYLAIRFVNRSIDKLAQTRAVTKHQSEVAYHVADVAIVCIAMTMILTIWGIDLTNVFIGAGAITAVVALTARETLTAMLAGFILLFSRPFYVGDWIEVNEASGIVTDVTIFTTKIQTFDDKHVLIPNDQVTSSQLTNYSQNDQLRVAVDVGIDYDDDPERARSVIVDAVSDLESIKNAPNPQVIGKRFDDSAIVLECRVWIADPTMRRKLDAQTDVMEAIVDAFDREGIEIPYPQRVHTARNDGFRIEGARSSESAISTLED